MYKRKAGIIVAGAAIGGAQTFLLREFVDKQTGAIIPGIGAWGNPSTLVGLGGGGIATLLGIAGAMNKGPITNDEYISGLLAYGVPALVGGVYSGLYPVGGATAARTVRPSATVSLSSASQSTPSSSSGGKILA